MNIDRSTLPFVLSKVSRDSVSTWTVQAKKKIAFVLLELIEKFAPTKLSPSMNRMVEHPFHIHLILEKKETIDCALAVVRNCTNHPL